MGFHRGGKKKAESHEAANYGTRALGMLPAMRTFEGNSASDAKEWLAAAA